MAYVLATISQHECYTYYYIFYFKITLGSRFFFFKIGTLSMFFKLRLRLKNSRVRSRGASSSE